MVYSLGGVTGAMAECEDVKAKESRMGEMGEMVQEFRARAHRIFPPEFRQHMLTARREFLLAVRALVDARIEALEREEKVSAKKATKVTVE